MDAIKAFVGHSFAEDDEEVVRRIIALLNEIGRLNQNFTWVTAKDPEPQLVADKVLERFSDKNLFIGICTNKERVIDDSALSRPWKLQPKRSAGADQFAWKTSDWLIQEIGIAVGRGMKIILLLEKGIRRPGAIQGDLEFIEFQRSEPEKCAARLMAMIASLNPAGEKIAQSPAAADTVAPESESSEPASPPWDWQNPRPEWTWQDYEQAVYFAVLEHADSVVEKITAAYLASAHGVAEEDQRKWKAEIDYARIAFGRGGSLDALKQNADRAPAIGPVLALLARAYRAYGEHASSLTTFERAIDAEADTRQRIQYLGEAVIEAKEAGQSARVGTMLERIRQLGSDDPEAEKSVLAAERPFAEKFFDKNVTLGLLERLVELEPANVDYRFKLAYAYGDLDMEDLAVYHYTKIPRGERDSSAWNNLGAALVALGIPGRAVSALRESVKKGETLAMSNLADRFSSAGFLEEASTLLNSAAAIPDHHQNVDGALAKLKRTPEEERKKEDNLSEKAAGVSEFYRHFGRALGLPRPEQIATAWSSQYGVLSMSTKGDSLMFSGKYEIQMGLGLLGNLFSPYALGGYSAGSPPKEAYEIEFSGTLHGRAVVAQVRRTKAGQALTAVSILDGTTSTVLMWIHDDSSKISIMEREAKGEPKFYEMTRTA